MLTRGGNGLGRFIGFSENVTLGEIGDLKRNDETVMRVRLDDPHPQPGRELRWRGVALDEFTGRGWKKSTEARHTDQKPNEHGFFQTGTTEAFHRLTTQTVFLEPMETPVLFAAPQPIAIQGEFPFVRVDAEGSIQSRRHEFDRLIYKAISDTTEPDVEALRSDIRAYPTSYQRYLRLPETLDPRIAALANAMIVNTHARNRYDEAKAIELQLQTNYAYSLQMKASGPDPVADFLFNVKAGHCEYFSTAMTVMLRTRGIAARVVNGFLPGEYNESSGAYTVRQSDAHSWVEVYFPEGHSWVTFDPTPAAGRTEPVRTGLGVQLGKYAEALELMWFQYVVGYDKQEQRSLATSLHNHLFDYGRFVSQTVAAIKNTSQANLRTVGLFTLVLLGLVMLAVIGRRARLLGWRKALRIAPREPGAEFSSVVFYERLTNLLAQRGLLRDAHLTPLEFANTINLGEALDVTRAYNRVRFGREQLSADELVEINRVLVNLEGVDK
jgi:transglutaminase-like putative cysteine protease